MKVELTVEEVAGAYLIGGFSGARPLFHAMTRDRTIQLRREGIEDFLPIFNCGKGKKGKGVGNAIPHNNDKQDERIKGR
jgi:hypothetical protein